MRKLWWMAAILVLVSVRPTPTVAQDSPAIRITILGDSIDADEPPERPIQGWGTYLQSKLIGAKVTNLALNGRSTKTFLHGETNKNGTHNDPKNWIKAQATPADYWIIKFGNNDSHPARDQRHTNPDTEYAANLKIFVETARKLGIKPILITPPDRPSWANALAEVIGYYSMTPYANAERRVSKEENVPLIDMYAQSHVWFTTLDPTVLSQYLPSKLGGHTSKAGAEFVAQWMAGQLVNVIPGLKLASANAAK
jgi:lysophospholipase L1-like esterase